MTCTIAARTRCAARPLGGPFDVDPASDLIQDLRRTLGGNFIVNSGSSYMITRDEAVAVGRPAIANLDLVTRWLQGADENQATQATV